MEISISARVVAIGWHLASAIGPRWPFARSRWLWTFSASALQPQAEPESLRCFDHPRSAASLHALWMSFYFFLFVEERRTANSGTSTTGTDVIIISNAVWLKRFLGTSGSRQRFVHLHCPSSQFADAKVRNMLRDNKVFLVVQNMLADFAPPFPWP